MQILRKILRRPTDAAVVLRKGPATAATSEAPHNPQGEVEDDAPNSPENLVKLTGTTTFSKSAMDALAARHGIGDGGYLETSGTMQRESQNRADPDAIAVHIEGERIGYVPGPIARAVQLEDNGARVVEVQVFTELLPKGLRAEAWVWLGQGAPHWQWSATNRPPMSPDAKNQAAHVGSSAMVRDALAQGGSRAKSFADGMVNGLHYLELVEPIKQLKREGRNEDALELCYGAIAAAENAREGMEPSPWYTEQAAIIHRKLRQHDEEVAVLERWLEVCPPERRDGSKIAQRLEKLKSSR